ncbi:MAG: PmoA family protein [Bacteroidales bacterium]|nr:PmoA family protein [Bacteroidales bacterium]
MRKRNLLLAGLITVIITGISSCIKKSKFSFEENPEGIKLSEAGDPVFIYQRKPKSANGQYTFNNYLHPVYNLLGEIITEEFPPDHLHQRGIYWAWHQIYLDNQNLGDGWMMEKISFDVTEVRKKINSKSARLDITINWKSTLLPGGKPFVEEETSILVYKKDTNIRKIDFEIILRPLMPGIQIGGSDDEKGYGGFCIRLKMPEDLIFTSETGSVTPQNLQINSGPWMDFSAVFGSSGEKTGVAILCHPSNPGHPEPWILRQKESMQNVVFPGRKKTNLDNPLILSYRVVIHDGDASEVNLSGLQEEYNKMYKGK